MYHQMIIEEKLPLTIGGGIGQSRICMILLEKYPDSKGFNIVNNNGSCAGQTVNHFHIHVILRYDNDNIKIL